MRTRLIAILLALGASGCGSYKSDLQMICDSPSLSGASSPSIDPAERASRIAAYVSQHIKTDTARQFFGSLATVPPADRAAFLRHELDKQGVGRCEFLELQAPPAQPATP